MTNGIDTLELRNFKAFPELQQFKFEGKHILMYGENGSGKSSIYWALYTLLQSTVPNKDFRKYFSAASTENLMNQQMISRPDYDSYIRFSLLDRPEHFFKLSSEGLTGDEANSNRLISETNLASDFISHRLLTNVYNFRNSDEIDLFPVFERDVFPFLQTTSSGENIGKNYSDIQKQIGKAFPFKKAKVAAKLYNDRSKVGTYIKGIEVFNNLIEKLIKDLSVVEEGVTENRLTNFYNKYFAPKDHDKIKEGEKLRLELTLEPMSYDFYKYEQVIEGTTCNFTSRETRILQMPKVKIKIQRELDSSWRNINRPQSFFNEARLTRIALAIRFCILDVNRPISSPTKILALDDLLISLDMSNRETVLDFLLSKYQNDFQLIILTHERAFFHLAKRKIERLHNKLGDWKLFEIYEYEKDGLLKPKVLEHKDHLAQAIEHFKETKDYPACANSQRSWLEGWLIDFIPDHERRSRKGKPIISLSGILSTAAKPYFDKLSFDKSVLQELDNYREFLLNPMSHYYNAQYEVYRSDLQKIFDLFKILQGFKNEPILKVNEVMAVRITTNEGVNYELFCKFKDDFRLLKEGANTSYSESTVKLEFFQSNTNGVSKDFKHECINMTLLDIYDGLCNVIQNKFKQTPQRATEMLDVFRNANGDSIRQLIDRMY